MSTTERPMPDFADALERHLRHAAAEAAAGRLDASPLPDVAVTAPVAGPSSRAGAAHTPGGRRRTRTRPAGRPFRLGRPAAALGTVALLVALVVGLLVAGGSGPTTGRAYGAPLVLKTPLVDLPTYVRPKSFARMIIGPDALTITRGHEIPLPDGGTGYLYGTAEGQCLWAPDPLTPETEDGGTTCVPTVDFLRFGIVLGMGTDSQGTLVAALPQGVRDPVVSRRGQIDRTLTPSTDGVVAITAFRPTTLTLFDRFGNRRPTTVATPLTPETHPVQVNPLRNELPGVTIPGTPPDPVPVLGPDFSRPTLPGYPPIDVDEELRTLERGGP